MPDGVIGDDWWLEAEFRTHVDRTLPMPGGVGKGKKGKFARVCQVVPQKVAYSPEWG